MSDDFSQVFAALDALKPKIVQGAAAGLDGIAPQVEAEAKATSAYKGVTGATRAGTVAYVVGAGVDSSGVLGEAVAAVEDRNPDHVLLQTVETLGDDEIALVLTVPTDYVDQIITRSAGAADFIGSPIVQHATQIGEAAAAGIAKVLT